MEVVEFASGEFGGSKRPEQAQGHLIGFGRFLEFRSMYRESYKLSRDE